MIEAKLQVLSGILAALATVAGFIAPWPVVVTGLFFAMAGGCIGLVVSPVQHGDPRWRFLGTLAVAVVIGGLAGIAHPHLAIVSWLPVQLVMGVSGVCSRWAARRLSNGDFSLPQFGRREGEL